ncbi:hypothetical protein [Pseudomonas zhanjiangensis]|uniref:Uncharacterized protein n=1 Tax=Pseudomonas zhanjiangensis TaxID=3239015 RepID=A0ABV3YXC3_9PSED
MGQATSLAAQAGHRWPARIDYDLEILEQYARALKPLRERIDLSISAFANGM